MLLHKRIEEAPKAFDKNKSTKVDVDIKEIKKNIYVLPSELQDLKLNYISRCIECRKTLIKYETIVKLNRGKINEKKLDIYI